MSNVKVELIKLILKQQNLVEDFEDFFKSHTGIILDISQGLKELNSLDNRVLLDILEGAMNDTDVREQILDQHALNMVDENWPINADGAEASKNFIKKLAKAYKEKGYRLYEE